MSTAGTNRIIQQYDKLHECDEAHAPSHSKLRTISFEQYFSSVVRNMCDMNMLWTLLNLHDMNMLWIFNHKNMLLLYMI